MVPQHAYPDVVRTGPQNVQPAPTLGIRRRAVRPAAPEPVRHPGIAVPHPDPNPPRLLLEMNEREHIAIHVIPFAAGTFAGSGQSVYCAEGPVPQLDTVNLDQSHGPVFLDAEAS
ncbi:hypothetical protein ACIRVK_29505 [Streptomyces sp. NPDC101152]|uniref:hypothetical protein n=1 Tax=Streptomyces sp. NPDC101152 TaxID=3366116 RepID=UPI0038155C62